MPIAMRCPGCDHVLYAPDTAAGRTVGCSRCPQEMIVPGTKVPRQPIAATLAEPDFEVVEDDAPPRRRPPLNRDVDERPRPRPPLRRDDDDDDEDCPKRSSKKKRKKDDGTMAKIAGILTGGLAVLAVVVVVGFKLFKVGVAANKIDRIVNNNSSNTGGNVGGGAPAPGAVWTDFAVGPVRGKSPTAMSPSAEERRKMLRNGGSGEMYASTYGNYRFYAGYMMVDGGLNPDPNVQATALSIMANQMKSAIQGGNVSDITVNGRPGKSIAGVDRGVSIVIRITFNSDRLAIIGVDARNTNPSDSTINQFLDGITVD